jgi:trk system potassium uptake protein TrkA
MAHTVVEADDEVFFIAAREHITHVIRELRTGDKKNKRIIIAGGGNIGKRLAERLESRHQVKIMERNPERARYLSQALGHTVVLLGDSANEELLLEENIESMDVFCSVTNDDEANILSAMLAKKLGARKVMSIINRPAYVDLMENQEAIDVAISPEQVTIGALLTHVRRGDVVSVHSLRRGAAEAIEAIAHGDENTSKVVGRSIEQIGLPQGTTIGAIVRGKDVIIAHHDTVIEAEDHVILFLIDKSKIHEVERLFQVGITFI